MAVCKSMRTFCVYKSLVYAASSKQKLLRDQIDAKGDSWESAIPVY